jgi:hypothetical protein
MNHHQNQRSPTMNPQKDEVKLEHKQNVVLTIRRNTSKTIKRVIIVNQ